ncbi:MAG: hypothetical protein ACREED_08815, partial [Stellaceae bacterium]
MPAATSRDSSENAWKTQGKADDDAAVNVCPASNLTRAHIPCYEMNDHEDHRDRMAKPQPNSKSSERTNAVIDSALRTLEAEGDGVAALATALRDRLGPAFIAAIELIDSGQGRVIVTGMGKSGHIGRKIASTFASTGTPAL